MSSSSAPVRLQAPQGHPSFLWRVLLGLALAQGLFHGLRHLTLAWLLRRGEGMEFFDTPEGTLTLIGGQLVCLFLAAVVAGSGLPRAVLLGGLLSFLNAAIRVGSDWWVRGELNSSLLLSEPALHLLAGTVGGLVGRLIWKPLPPLPRYDTPGSSASIKEKDQPIYHDGGPLIWSRILTGAVFAFVGTVFAQELRGSMGRYARTSSLFFDQFVNWQIGALTVLLGGAVAGANTRRGFAHGGMVALIACVALVVTQYSKNVVYFAAHKFWLDQLEIKSNGSTVEPTLVIFAVLHTATLALLGGWLGSQLLQRRGRAAPMGMSRV